MKRILVLALMAVLGAASVAHAQVNYPGGGSAGGAVTLPPSFVNNNGSPGSVAHSAVTTAYTANELWALNTTGNAVPVQIPVTATNGGTGNILHALCSMSGTGSTAPPGLIVYLFRAAPTTTSLVDRSSYVGPYAADITSGAYLGSISCASFAATNDHGTTGPWFSEGTASNILAGGMPYQALSGQAYVDGLVAVTGAYTPIASEAVTIVLSTTRDQ